MYSIVGIVFCLLVGILLAHFGWIALLWTPMGFIVGLYLSANMILPITLGVPMAFSYTVKKQIRPRVFWAILRTPLFAPLLVFFHQQRLGKLNLCCCGWWAWLMLALTSTTAQNLV